MDDHTIDRTCLEERAKRVIRLLALCKKIEKIAMRRGLRFRTGFEDDFKLLSNFDDEKFSDVEHYVLAIAAGLRLEVDSLAVGTVLGS